METSLDDDSLVQKIFKGRYYPMIFFLTARYGFQPSCTWQSIVKGCEILDLGLRWYIGDGKKVHIWGDKWLPNKMVSKFGLRSPCWVQIQMRP